MKLEAIWILTNLAYGTSDDIMRILSPEFGILPAVNTILQTSDKPLLEQILWFVGNISGENKIYQEMIIHNTCIFEVLHSLIE